MDEWVVSGHKLGPSLPSVLQVLFVGMPLDQSTIGRKVNYCRAAIGLNRDSLVPFGGLLILSGRHVVVAGALVLLAPPNGVRGTIGR